MKSFAQSSTGKHLIKISLFFTALTVICLVYLVYKNVLAKNSIRLIPELQKEENSARVSFFKFIYGLANKRSFFMSVMVLFNFLSRQTSFYLAVVLNMSLYILVILKMIYTEGRPFMKQREIYPYICELTFANPSMESTNSFLFSVVYSLLIYEQVKQRQLKLNRCWKSGLLILAGIATVILVIVVCL